MKKLITLLFAVFISFSLLGQNIELSNSLIRQYKEGQQKTNQKNATIEEHLWLTPILKEALTHWDELTDEAKEVFKKYRDRPTFSGTEQTYDIGNFKFHYTTDSGYDDEDVDPTDVNPANGVPDYVDNMASKFVNDVYANYHTNTGLTVPPSDGTEGGDGLYDIYISGYAAGEGTYGYVAPETEIGDNPNSTDITEYDASTSYMVMRNNYDGFGDENIAMSVTAAHEYMHGVQMGYSVSMEAWFMEVCAVWSEDYIYPGYDDNLQYLMDLFGKPDVALNLENGEAGGAYDNHWYSQWLFAKYMTEHTGNEIIKNIYERCIDYYAVYAIDNELTENWESSLDLMFLQFVIANVLMTDEANFEPYTYSRAEDYYDYITDNGGLKFENSENPFNYTGTDINWNSQTDGNDRLMRLSADYFLLEANQNFKITFSPVPDNDETGLILLKLTDTSLEIEVSDENGEINVTDQANWTYFVPIVVRLDKDVENTDPYDYTLTITEADLSSIETANKTNIEIYPNPASDFVNIINPTASTLNVTITDITGKVVINQNLGDNNRINVKNLDNGVYLLAVKENNKLIKIESIVISH